MNRASLSIQTPEGIVFSFPLAGPITRFLAWLVDLAAILAIVTFVDQVGRLIGLVSPDVGRAVTILAFFAVSLGYGIVFEWYARGQTLGKRLLHLRVIDASGLKLRPAQVVVRNLLRAVDSLPLFYVVGGAACLLSPRLQRLGDLAAGTVVVRNLPLEEPDVEQILAGKYNSLAAHPLTVGRLRQRVSPEEASLALAAVLRRDRFEPATRLALFARIAEHLRSLVPIPEDSLEGLSDEQLVRNVVDVLFRSRPR